MSPHFDTLIIGAGVIGSAVARALGESDLGSVLVIDPSLKGERSSSELNAGGVRATWSQDHHIEASIETIEYFSRHKEETGYRDVGYLWLKNSAQVNQTQSNLTKWKDFHWPVETWSRAQIKSKYPWMDRVEDIEEAWFAPRDGLVNPNLVKSFYRLNAAQFPKVVFRDRTVLLGVSKKGGGDLFEVTLGYLRLQQNDYAQSLIVEVEHLESPDKYFEKIETVTTSRLVNCAGAWASLVCKRMGYERPSRAIRRQISLFDCRGVSSENLGMIVDTSGVYFHPEADYFLSGFADPLEPTSYSFAYDGDGFFDEKIWTPLSQRSSHFESLRHVTGWSGLYEVSPDENAFAGEVLDSSLNSGGQIYEAHSFSGHGVMHSYSVSEQLVKQMKGEQTARWFRPLSGSRAALGQWNHEHAVI